MTTIPDGRHEFRRTTTESRPHENDIINDSDKEPAMNCADAPSSQDRRIYVGWGALALVVVVALVSAAIFVS